MSTSSSTFISERRSGLLRLLHLSQEQMQKLYNAVEAAHPTLTISAFSRQVASMSEIDENIVSDIIWAVGGIYYVSFAAGRSLRDIVQDIRWELESADSEVTLHEDNLGELEKRLMMFLELHASLGVTAKARMLVGLHEPVFLDAQVVSDIRPVFGENPEEPPLAAIVLHRLRISYRDGEQEKDFSVVLETQEIADVRTTLNRADLKAKSLLALLKSAGLPIVEEDARNESNAR